MSCHSEARCIFEFHLEYPDHLHNLHNEYPLAPEWLFADCCVVSESGYYTSSAKNAIFYSIPEFFVCTYVM